MKFVRLIFVICMFASVLLISAPVGAQEGETVEPEKAISQYIEAKNLKLEVDSSEYGIFIKDILWGLHPELSQGPNGDSVLRYAADYVNRGSVEFASKGLTLSEEENVQPEFSGYNRQAVVNYAYAWTQNGGRRRNSGFPDFTDNDCTNFVSQAVWSGGVPRNGSGDGCRDEVTTSEWYSYSANPPLWCIGSNRNFVWSSGWSVVADFWRYQTQYRHNATSSTYSGSQLSQLRSAAALGDIVQLQNASGGAKWHSMVVTRKQNGEIYLTYHSGPNGLDVVDKSLANVAATGSYSYWLIHF